MKPIARLCKDLLLDIPAVVALVGGRIEYNDDPKLSDIPKVAFTVGPRRTAPYGLRNFYIYPLTIRYLDTIDRVSTCFDMEAAITNVFNNFAGLTFEGHDVKWINFLSSDVNKYTEAIMEAEIFLEVHANL